MHTPGTSVKPVAASLRLSERASFPGWVKDRQELLFPVGLKTIASCQGPSTLHKTHLAILG